MSKLLKFEFRKLFTQKSFYVCLIIGLAFVVLNELTTWFMAKYMSVIETGAVTITGSGFDDSVYNAFVSMMRAMAESEFEILGAVFISISICADYTMLTIRTVCTKGYSRLQILVAKYITVICATLIYYLVCLLTGFVSGASIWGLGTVNVSDLLCVFLGQFCVVLGYATLFYCIAICFRKNAPSIAIGIVIPIIGSLVTSVCNLALSAQFDWDFDFSEILLTQYLSSTSDFVGSDIGKLMGYSIVVSMAYIVLCACITWIFSRKREV